MKVTIAVDLDIESDDIEAIVSLAQKDRWELSLVHVVSPQPVVFEPDFAGVIPPVPTDTRRAETRVEEIAESFRSNELVVETMVEIGEPVYGIIRAANAANSSMIVAVARHHNLVHRVVLGSVVSGLVKSSPRPVLVLPNRERRVSELDCAVDRLFEVAERQDNDVDLTEMKEALEAHRAEPHSEEHRFALHGALQRLERDHPNLVIATNNVNFYLRTVGI